MTLWQSAAYGIRSGAFIGCAIASIDLILNAATGGFMFTNVANQWVALLPNLIGGTLTAAVIGGSVFTIGHTMGSVLGIANPAPTSPSQSTDKPARSQQQGRVNQSDHTKQYAFNAYDRENTWEEEYYERQAEREQNSVSR